jgi:hypothetical protein
MEADPPDAVAPDAWIDCVGVLHVRASRGHEFANVRRFGEGSPTLRTTARLVELSPTDLGAFCDWEACVRANGYAHSCWVTDAGWERCRVCDGGDDCDGFPMTGGDCMAHVGDPARAACHVGLLQECLIQRGLRGFSDSRVTETCRESQQACAGQLPGDLTAQALAAQHETDQVTMEIMLWELDLADRLQPDSSVVQAWRATMPAWEGGLPDGDMDGGCQAFPDATPGD